MLKKPVIITAAIIIITAVSIFIYRYQILQYTAESLIRKYLPAYVSIDTIKFDFTKSDIILTGFRMSNPPGFSNPNLIEINKITCHYALQGKNMLNGFVLSNPVLTDASLDIERLGDGRLNLFEAQSIMIKNPAASSKGNPEEQAAPDKGKQEADKNAGVILPEVFTLKNAKMTFSDGMVGDRPHVISLENIDTVLTMKMNRQCTRVLSVTAVGGGNLMGDRAQSVRWTIGMDPTAQRLTMSNRFEVSGVFIPLFEPYYDKYSPLVFKSGRFSGLLIFDFDNGMIGSSDELHLSGIKFFVKPGYENAIFWETTVPDLVKYFTSPYGDIIFDFKIKGDMADPKFYLGPKSKKAIVAMAIDKISEAMQKTAASGNGQGAKSDIEKAQDYIELFRGLIKK